MDQLFNSATEKTPLVRFLYFFLFPFPPSLLPLFFPPFSPSHPFSLSPDVSNCQYLKKFDFVAENFDGFLHKYGVKKIPQAVDTTSVEVHKRKSQKAKKKWDRDNDKMIEVFSSSSSSPTSFSNPFSFRLMEPSISSKNKEHPRRFISEN